jgi:tetratricopeptide (TPR) repeat protein
MTHKPPEGRDSLLELIKKLWLPVAGFIGAITLIYNFYKLWQGDQSTIIILTIGTGLAIWVTSLFWVGFSNLKIIRDADWPKGTKLIETFPRYSLGIRRIARVGLVITVIVSVAGLAILQRQREELREELSTQVIAVIAAFDGPEDKYGIRNQIIEQLTSSLADFKDIKIIPVEEIITPTQGSEYARQIGKGYQADIVLWAWYKPTDNPNITLHIENLSPQELIILEDKKTVNKPEATRADLESFSLQQQLGNELSGLITFLAGYFQFLAEDYEAALVRFDQALSQPDWIEEFGINQAEVYSLRALAKDKLGQSEKAKTDYNKALQVSPQNAREYYVRGLNYYNLGQYMAAINDFENAIEIEPDFVEAYNGLGAIYYYMADFNRAVVNFDKAIQINPEYAAAYRNRGNAYSNVGEYEQAIEDYDRAIQIDPQDADSYYNRGVAYTELEEYDRAIQDFDKAIEINPQIAEAYYSRGFAYRQLGETAEAEADFKKYEELTGKKP